MSTQASDHEALLHYYRFDSPTIASTLLRAGVCIAIGGPTVLLGSLSLFFHVPPWGKVAAVLVGGTFLAFGLFTGFVRVPQLLSVDSGLSVRKDGVSIERGDNAAFYTWDAILRASCEDGKLVLHIRDAAPQVVSETFARDEADQVARVIERTRLRSALAML